MLGRQTAMLSTAVGLHKAPSERVLINDAYVA
jgi:hypothetical protein